MNKNVIIIGIVIAVLAIGGFLYIKNNHSAPIAANSKYSAEPMSSSAQKNIKEFTINGRNYVFDRTSITVNKGDRVKITFKNGEGTHNLVIGGFNVTTKTIQAGQEDTIEFTADKKGMFAYYCSIGNHRQQGMEGMLMVM